MKQNLLAFGRNMQPLIIGALGAWLFMFFMAYIMASDWTVYLPPSPITLGACAANQYDVMCTGVWLKGDLQVPIEPKIQDRIIPE